MSAIAMGRKVQGSEPNKEQKESTSECDLLIAPGDEPERHGGE